MSRPTLRHMLAIALAVGMLLPALAGAPPVHATSPRQAAPPGVNPAQPAVSGRLVAKATGKAGVTGAAVCRVGAAAPTAMIVRGLVICTDAGTLVLLQIAPSTGIFNREWQRLTYARLAIGDRLNAWGVLRDAGTLLNPTLAIQDLSRTGPRFATVKGRLVVSPNATPGGPVVCGDRDRTGDAQTLMANRGLVICTEEGKLVLLQISGTTRLLTHDRAPVTVEDLTLGDVLTGRGTLTAGGYVLSPTVSVVDANLQRKGTDSQDFIAGGGRVLSLYVLKSDAGPVRGRVYAVRGEPSHITLCRGGQGTWADLRQGLTVNVSNSLFNTRTTTYVDTNTITVVSCA